MNLLKLLRPKPKPLPTIASTLNPQDDAYVAIATAISYSKTEADLIKCIKPIMEYQKKYGNTIGGEKDIDMLVEQYNKKEASL